MLTASQSTHGPLGLNTSAAAASALVVGASVGESVLVLPGSVGAPETLALGASEGGDERAGDAVGAAVDAVGESVGVSVVGVSVGADVTTCPLRMHHEIM